MESEPYTTQRTTSSTGYSNRDQAIYATERARVLFGCYRRGDANDPDAYVAAIAAVLSTYEPDLIRRVTDPRTGISTTEKFRTFMPNSGELKAYCEEQAVVADRVRRYAALPAPNWKALPKPPPAPGDRANLFVHKGHPGYDEMVARAQHPDANPREWKWDEHGREGIWVNMNWYGRGRTVSAGLRQFTDEDLREIYATRAKPEAAE